MKVAITKKPLLGVNVSATDYQQVVETLLAASLQPQPLKFTALDAHGLSRGAKDPRFRDLLNAFDIVSPDGHSLRWGLNLLHGENLRDRVAGPDLTLRVCAAAAAHGCPVFLYGSHPHVLAGMGTRLTRQFPALNIAGVQPSRFRSSSPEEDAQDIELIQRSGARLVFVGLGCPLQEEWVAAHAPCLSLPLLAVGAAFDFISGNKPRAPRWMQNAGIEWIFRIAAEPRRLLRRSLPAVAYVFFALVWQKLHPAHFARQQRAWVSSASSKT